MRIRDAIARLQRAGSETSRQNQKLRQAASDIMDFLKKAYPHGGEHTLPMGCTFQHWDSGDLVFKCPDPAFKLTATQKSVESLHRFGTLILRGWLNEVARALESDSYTTKRAIDGVGDFLLAQELKTRPAAHRYETHNG